MSQALPTPDCCESSCDPIVSQGTPGTPGTNGTDGSNGSNGANAWDQLAAGFTMPAEGANVTIELTGTTDWLVQDEAAVQGHILVIQFAGYLEVVSITDATHAVVKNLANVASGLYVTNAAPTTPIPISSRVCSAGLQGPAGPAAAGALLIANNLNDVANAAASRGNLGLGTMAVQAASAVAITGGSITGITDLAVADGGTGASTQADARTNLGLVIGTNVQAFDATLQSLSALGTAANKVAITTGVDTWAELDVSAFAQTVLNDANAATFLNTLGVQAVNQGRICVVQDIDMNAIADTAIGIVSATRYRIDEVIIYRPTTLINGVVGTSLNVATVGLFTAAGGAGTTLAVDQSLAALTAIEKFKSLTLAGVTGTDYRTEVTLYLRVGTAQGAAAYAKALIFATALQ